MIAFFAFNTGVFLGLVLLFLLLFLLLFGAALSLESEQGRELWRGFRWFRQLEQLRPAELHFRGMVSLGAGICCFAALLTLKLFAPIPAWSALLLGALTVLAITIGAAFLERAARF
jgi:hypothetical protein